MVELVRFTVPKSPEPELVRPQPALALLSLRELPEIVLLLIFIVPPEPDLKMPPPLPPLASPAKLPEMVQPVIVTVPKVPLRMPPPTEPPGVPTALPLEMVRPEMVTGKKPVPPLRSKMRNCGVPPALLRCTVNTLAPGPVIVRSLLINNSALVSVIVVRPEAKLIVSPDAASRIACRSEPAPLSLVLVTVMVVAA